MTTLSNLSDTAWSSDIGATTGETPIQCRSGYCYVSWAASAPADLQDGIYLGPGDIIVVPTGTTFRVSKANGSDPVIFYEEF